MVDILGKIEEAEDFVFQNEAEFLDEFAKGMPEELASLGFGSEKVEFTYVMECGQHICDSVKMDKFLKWMDNLS